MKRIKPVGLSSGINIRVIKYYTRTAYINCYVIFVFTENINDPFERFSRFVRVQFYS